MSLKVLGYTLGTRTKKLLLAAKVGGADVAFVDIKFGVDNETPEWALNCHPLGRAPVLETPDAGYIFESNAIFRHLMRVAKNKGLYGKSDAEASQVDSWIDFTANELDNHAFPVFYTPLGYANLTPEQIDAEQECLHVALAGLEARLENRTFLVGERLSGADLAVFATVELVLSGLPRSSEFWKYKNVLRWYQTVFYAHPGVAEAQKANGGTGFPVEKPKDAPKPAPAKKETPAAAAAGAGGDDDDGDDAAAHEGPKKKNALDELPPSKFIGDEWKRMYSNEKDSKKAAAWLFEHFDAEGWSMWWARYKYNDELSKSFMTSNLVRGWFQRMEGVRKYCFGVALTLGTEEKHEICSFWIVRGTGETLPECVREVEDVSLHEWRRADPKADKDLIVDYLCWEGPNLGKPVLEGRCFK